MFARRESDRCDGAEIVGVNRRDTNVRKRQAHDVTGFELGLPPKRVRHEAVWLQEGPGEARVTHRLLGEDVIPPHGVAHVAARSRRARQEDDSLDAGASHLSQGLLQLAIAAEEKHGTNGLQGAAQARCTIEVADCGLDAGWPERLVRPLSNERAHRTPGNLTDFLRSGGPGTASGLVWPGAPGSDFRGGRMLGCLCLSRGSVDGDLDSPSEPSRRVDLPPSWRGCRTGRRAWPVGAPKLRDRRL